MCGTSSQTWWTGEPWRVSNGTVKSGEKRTSESGIKQSSDFKNKKKKRVIIVVFCDYCATPCAQMCVSILLLYSKIFHPVIQNIKKKSILNIAHK